MKYETNKMQRLPLLHFSPLTASVRQTSALVRLFPSIIRAARHYEMFAALYSNKKDTCNQTCYFYKLTLT
jgi:hypothetical protein